MVKGKTNVGNNGLFPSTWVVGEAAAELSRDDDGVLLAEPLRSEKRAGAPAADVASTLPADGQDQSSDDPWPEPVIDEAALEAAADTAAVAEPSVVADEDPSVAVARRREQEIAELHAENERLRRRITLTRRIPDSGGSTHAAEPPEAAGLPFMLPGDPAPGVEAHRGRAFGSRGLILFVILLVGAGLVAAWYLGNRADAPNGSTQQVETLGDGMRAAISDLNVQRIARHLRDAVAGVSAWIDGMGQTSDAEPSDPPGEQSTGEPAPPAAAAAAR